MPDAVGGRQLAPTAPQRNPSMYRQSVLLPIRIVKSGFWQAELWTVLVGAKGRQRALNAGQPLTCDGPRSGRAIRWTRLSKCGKYTLAECRSWERPRRQGKGEPSERESTIVRCL